MDIKPPKVALVGRRNVGKSTLFNALVEELKSMVSPIAGTTRDRFEADCLWRGQVIRLVDTGGLDIDVNDSMEASVADQANAAINEAQLILFVVDAGIPPTPEDLELARSLKASGKPVMVVGNKADNAKIRERVEGDDWTKWPLDRPFPISARRSIRLGDLLDQVFIKLEELKTPAVDVRDVSSVRVAVLGRPNVGKSSLLNAIIGEERFIASEVEHTTRQPNDFPIEVEGKHYVFIDTAGVRKLARIKDSKNELEYPGVEASLKAVERAEVVLFVLDVTAEINHQDRHLAGLLSEAGASVVIVMNKWDLIPDKDSATINKYEDYVRAWLPQLKYAPIVFVSALTKLRAQTLFAAIDRVYQSRFTDLTDVETDGFIRQAVTRHKPSRGKGVQHPKIISFTQVGVNPPKFALLIKQSRKEALSPSYVAFLQNMLREEFDFEGTPLRIVVRGGKKKHVT